MSDDFIVAAARLQRPWLRKRWAFYLINNSPESIDSAILKEVGYEWGDWGSVKNPEAQFLGVTPGTCVEIWRDDDSAAELRMWLKILIRRAEGPQTLTVEFPKLYRVGTLSVVPVLGKPGFVGTGTLTAPTEPQA